jgi:Ca-activated chloride channel family protein
MNLRSRLLLLALVCIYVALLMPRLLFAQDPDETADKTASPYFFLSGEPGVDRLPLKSTRVDAQIAGVIADVKVVQRYKNEGARAIEAVYVFPGSTRAAVHGLRMRVGERLVVARIREKAQARAEYESAKHAGQTASLLEQHRPNVFQMNLANILPGDEVEVELRYTELLVPAEGAYQFVFPTVVGPRYNGTPSMSTGAAERWPAMPFLPPGSAARSAFDLSVTLEAPLPIQQAVSPSHPIDVRFEENRRARVTLSADAGSANDRDFILDYRLAGERVESGVMLYQGADENFFLAMLEPPAAVEPRDIPPREYVFIVDVSGSMHGFPLDVSKALLRDLIGGLRARDSFNVLLFAGGNSVLSEESLPATPANVRRAIDTIDRQQGGGGTELLPALRRALALPRDPQRSRSIVIVTDGYVTVEPEAFDLVRERLDDANVFAFGIGSSVNRYLIEGLARAGRGEPFVVIEPGTAKAEAERFRKYIEAPVLTHVQLSFEGFDAYEVEPASVPDVFASRPVIVFGKWRGTRGGAITIDGMSSGGPYHRRYDLAGVEPAKDSAALRQLWARSRIATLSDHNSASRDDDRIRHITDLGLKYSLLTQYTSFVAVDQVVRNADPKDQVRVDQPSPLPSGVSHLAVAQEVPGTPEPQTWALLAVALGVLLWLKSTGRLRV